MSEKKKAFYKRWWFWVIAVVIVIGIGSIGGGDTQTSTSDTKKPQQTAEKAEEKKETNKVYAIGEEAKYKDVSITVTNVKRSNGGDFDKPKSGNEYVVVSLKIKNMGKNKISYNPFDYEMKNSKGQINNTGITLVNTDTALNSGDLAPGGEVEGSIAFEEPKGDNGLVLIYKGNLFSDNEHLQFSINK